MLYPRLLPLVALVASVWGAHSSTEYSHARRSLSRRQGLFGNLGNTLDDVVQNVPVVDGVADSLNGIVNPPPDPPQNNPPQQNNGDSSSAAASESDSSSASSVSSSTATTTATNTTTTVSSSSTGLLGGIGGGLDTVVAPITTLIGDPTETTTSTPTLTTNAPTTVILDPTSITDPGPLPTETTTADPDTTTSTDATSTTDPVTAPDPQITDPPTTTTSTTNGGILDPITSVLSPIVDPVTSIVDTLTSVIVDPVTSILDPVTSVVVDPVTSIISDIKPTTTILPPTTSILDPITTNLPNVTTVIPDPTPDPDTTSDGPTSLPDTTSDGPTSLPDNTSPGPTSLPDTTTPGPTSLPDTTAPGPTSLPDTTAPGPTSLPDTTTVLDPTGPSANITTTLGPTISFPEPTGSANATTTAEDSDTSPVTVTATVISTISIDPGLSFVLTETALAHATVPTTTVTPTITDPDEAITTAESIPIEAATTLIVSAPLPTGIPARIFPRDQLDLNSDLSGYTLISILFNEELSWPWVVQNTNSSSQIFAYLPVLIRTALDITADQVKSYALQVYIPTTYRNPSDVSKLGTTWLGYIPSDLVDTLAALIKAKSSPFYTGVPPGVARDLAGRVVPGFSLLSVPDENKPSDGGDVTTASGSNNKSRQDAIIGVVSALGAVALLVLVFLVYRSMKRRKQLAHRRLSDPPNEAAGVRPTGRQFDQDSVGGARRRSFYYAEDSLRGFEGHNDALLRDEMTPTTMTQRRPAQGPISTPVLNESTMHW